MKNSSQRKISFLVVFFGWGFFMSAGAQVNPKSLWVRDFTRLYFPQEMLKNKTADFLTVSQKPDPGYPHPAFTRISQPVIPANVYYCQSGFFCKREWELEKTTHIAFRFRLGSLDYCNVLEGKQRPAPF